MKYVDIEKKFEIKIPSVTRLVIITTLNTKATNIDNQIPDTVGFL